MAFPLRARVLAVTLALLAAHPARGAPKEIEAAVQKGVAYLLKGADNTREARDPDRVGATALVGLALLESGTPADDPAVKKITERVRDAAYTQTETYQLALCVLYLDRHGDPGDRPLIQMLAVRLLAGQNAGGGWTYSCVSSVPPATERFLRAKLSDATLVAGGKEPAALKPGVPPARPTTGPGVPAVTGKLHADVEKYRQGLLATDSKRPPHDDNSNTQFGILGVWTARKHGVPVEHALDLIEKRFLNTQGASGGWPYRGPNAGADGSASMTCAGLIGLATGLGRREERLLKTDAAKPPAVPAKKPDELTDPTDPFTNPPKPPPAEPVAPKARKPDARDAAVKRGMDHLAGALGGKPGKGRRGNADLYFLWSMERVGVIYGVNKIGATDWYEYASDVLVEEQNPNGSWGGPGRGGYGADVDTSFALLVLARSNLARDLSAKVQKELGGAELRAGAGGPVAAAKPEPAPKPESVPTPPAEVEPPPVKPIVPANPAPAKPIGTTPADIAGGLYRATGADWAAALEKVRDAKGAENTSALLAVIPLLDGDRKKTAREALAERLCRMSAATLRGMLKAEDVELRRASALACAMKDDKDHVPDLIALLEDKDEAVAKAARAGLKSLTGKDFATPAEWRAWAAQEKK